MRGLSLVVLCVVLAAVAPFTAGGGALPAGSASAPDSGGEAITTSVTQTAPSQSQPETDVLFTEIRLLPNGTAVWRVEFVTRLESDSEVEEYRAFQSEFRNRTDEFLGDYRERILPVVDRAENETGREMTARNFTASSSVQDVPRRTGVVTYQFRWTNFAVTDGDRLVAGDVFAGGFFLGTNDTLVVRAPEGYRIDAAEPAADERTDRRVTYNGQRSFDDERPRVVAVADPTPTATGTSVPATPTAPTPTAATTTRTTDTRGGLPLWLAGVVVLGLATAVGVAYRAGYIGSGTRSGPSGDGGSPDADDGDDEPPDAGAGDATTEPTDPYEAVLAEIRPPLTDEDRVRKALAENGGRMRQSDIADQLDWSASKTSRVLSDMADEGTIDKLRVGRQNVIDLAVDEE